MKRLIQLAGAAIAIASAAVLADNTPTQEKKAAAEPAARMVQPVQASKATRMSDAELDRVTAASATHEAGHGTTVIFNPGNANVLIRHKRGVTCVNCF